MAHDRDCRVLAEKFLADYRLSPAERREETGRLAETIQRVIESELEGLEHRKAN